MAYLSYHIAKVAQWSKIAGVFSIVIFGLAALVNVLVEWNIPEYQVERFPMWLLIAVWGGLYFIPGVLLWISGRLLESGRFWLFVPILLLAVFDLAKVFFFRFFGGFVCYVFLRFPTMVLIAYLLNAIPDIRDHYRRWRRENQPRGFQVIVNPTGPVKTPPPPGRQLRMRPPPKS